MSATLKVLDAKTEIASYQVQKGQALIIDAQDKVNYQLVDNSTGLGPQNIIAKRDGNNLQVILEDGDTLPDIIIKNYYGSAEKPEDVTNLLVGQHENGKIYAYVPESGQVPDAVSMLDAGDAAPQALGGDEISGLWVFSPWWLLALIPIAGAAALLAGGSSGGGDNNTPAPTPTPTPTPTPATAANQPTVELTAVNGNQTGGAQVTPAAGNNAVTITFKDEKGVEHTITATKDANGNWTLDNTPDGVSIDPTTGTVTFTPDALADGEEVSVVGK
ncbi:hypothetical protein [Conservatibacter flavescens]|uniref:Bacterial Ig domain-containing protein n=1 Tax=Conservatibacter flavescens TaxID=28161 RepID=A0A2M8S412_9PAST|nr:hypothetical protein [Conservatibacter flavescens]PJG85886.1 hypothetical protein CVP05_03905 [Conservatibacter flavescens]